MAIVMFPEVSFFQFVVATQVLNAVTLPLIFYYLITLASDKNLMGDFSNSTFQKWFAVVCTILIVVASAFTIMATVFPKLFL